MGNQSGKNREKLPPKAFDDGKLQNKVSRADVIRQLPQIREVLLGMILMVDRICQKHGIRYFLGGGTLLGAVRHGGFIPWDNDADIMLLRPDYDKLLQVLPRELPEGVFIQSCETEKTNHQPFIKLRLDGTLYATEFTMQHPEQHNGFFIDILAQDVTSGNRMGRKVHIFRTMLVRSMVFHKWAGTPIRKRKKEKNGIRWVSTPGTALATLLKRALPQSFLDKRMMRLLTKYRGKNTGWLYDGMGRNIGRGAFPAQWLSESVKLPLNGYELPVPKEYDLYLKYLYGDYQKLPPKKERFLAHNIPGFDLGKYKAYKTAEDPEHCMYIQN